MLDSHQRGIHDTLSGMEHEAARLAKEESALQDDATRYETSFADVLIYDSYYGSFAH